MPEAACIVASRSCSRFTVSLRNDGIIVYDPLPRQEVSIEFAVQVLELGLQVAGGRTRACLVLMPDVKRIDREARAFFASDLYLKLSHRTALVVSSPVSRVIGNFFVGLNRVKYPCKVFDDQERAVAWLRAGAELSTCAHGKREDCTSCSVPGRIARPQLVNR
jgi:hypothetical protein